MSSVCLAKNMRVKEIRSWIGRLVGERAMVSPARLTDSATFVPSAEEQGRLLSFVEAMERRGRDAEVQPVVVDTSGERYELTHEMADMLVRLLKTLASGQAVTLVPRQRLLTTQEAADLLNVSRPTLVKLLEAGDLAYEMRGRHRRIRLSDLLEYQEGLRRNRAAVLSDMQRTSQEAGLYDILDMAPSAKGWPVFNVVLDSCALVPVALADLLLCIAEAQGLWSSLVGSHPW